MNLGKVQMIDNALFAKRFKKVRAPNGTEGLSYAEGKSYH